MEFEVIDKEREGLEVEETLSVLMDGEEVLQEIHRRLVFPLNLFERFGNWLFPHKVIVNFVSTDKREVIETGWFESVSSQQWKNLLFGDEAKVKSNG